MKKNAKNDLKNFGRLSYKAILGESQCDLIIKVLVWARKIQVHRQLCKFIHSANLLLGLAVASIKMKKL